MSKIVLSMGGGLDKIQNFIELENLHEILYRYLDIRDLLCSW